MMTPSGPSPDKNSFKFTRIASGLQSPVYVTGAGDGSGRLFIVEQIGRIRILQNGVLLPAPFLDIRSLVVSGGERGLLSVAFHPQFKTNGVFVVDYTRASKTPSEVGDTVIERFTAGPSTDGPQEWVDLPAVVGTYRVRVVGEGVSLASRSFNLPG